MRSAYHLGMTCELLHIDAFASKPFTGNPAAVCLLDQPANAGWMQSVAAEMNLADTAFVSAATVGFDLRWFTPAIEVDLCGHATLAAAHALWEIGRLKRTEPAPFHTRSGQLVCVLKDDWIQMDFPASGVEKAAAPAGMLEALGVNPIAIARTAFDYLVQLESQAQVSAVKPDLRSLGKVETRGVIVTSRADDATVDFVSRFFAPAAGIDEDPVTGSSHCALAVYWQPILGRSRFTARQISKRGGMLHVELQSPRVMIAGQAVTIFRTNLAV